MNVFAIDCVILNLRKDTFPFSSTSENTDSSNFDDIDKDDVWYREGMQKMLVLL